LAEAVATNNAEIVEKYKRAEDAVLTAYKNFDEGFADYTGAYDKDDVKHWVRDSSYPLVMEFHELKDSKKSVIFDSVAISTYFLFYGNDEDSTQAKEDFKKLAKQNRGKVYFVQIDAKHSDNNKIVEYFGVEPDVIPCVRMGVGAPSQDGKLIKHKDKKEFFLSEEYLQQFLDDYLNGKIKSYLKSQPVPVDDGSAVKEVVGTTWRKIVGDPTKDVLVELYAPWCGHCKKLTPIFEAAAKRLQKVTRLTVAKMDSTNNEVEGVNVGSFPTLHWYPAWKKDQQPIEVKIDHTEEAIIEWVREHLTKKFTEELWGIYKSIVLICLVLVSVIVWKFH